MVTIRINVGELRIGPEERNSVNQVLDSGRISEGKMAKQFEEKWANFIGTKYSIVLNSGTSALIAGLMALQYSTNRLGFGKQKKVITTPLTYIATSNAIRLSGLEPVYVDIDIDSFSIDSANIQRLLEESDDPEEFCLILPVHLMGYPCCMDRINKIANKYGLLVFEDASQAHGSLINGKRAGSLSALSSFSFYIAHNIQVGEMGAVATNDFKIMRLIRKIKANGRICDCVICTRTIGCPKMQKNNAFDPRFTHDVLGYNFKTMDIPPALGLVQLEKIEWIIEQRRKNVRYLNEGLEHLSDVIKLPEYNENVSYMAYPVVIKDIKMARNKILMKLEEKGVETRPLFGCIPTQQPSFSHLKLEYSGKLPNAELIGSHGFYVGCHQYLSQSDLDYIINVFKEVFS